MHLAAPLRPRHFDGVGEQAGVVRVAGRAGSKEELLFEWLFLAHEAMLCLEPGRGEGEHDINSRLQIVRPLQGGRNCCV